MQDAILVTGASGFLGSSIIEELLATTQAPIYALVRPVQGRTAKQRLCSLWDGRTALTQALDERITPVEGDIERAQFGLSSEQYDQLAQSVGYIFHAAAEVSVNATRDHLYSVNVGGTHTALEFGKRASELGELKRFVHISTAYVVGMRKGNIPEELFAEGAFNSLYEWSKHEAELLVSAYGDAFPYTIVRPSQIVGNSKTGFISTFNTLYYPLKLYLRGQLRIIPASPDLRVNMVPVDYVARLTCAAAHETQAAQQVLHAVVPHSEQPTLEQVIAAVRLWTHEHLNITLPQPIYLPAGALAAVGRLRNLSESDAPKRKSFVRNLLALAPYFSEDHCFETARAQSVLQAHYAKAGSVSDAIAGDLADAAADAADVADAADAVTGDATGAVNAAATDAVNAAATAAASAAAGAPESAPAAPDWQEYLPRLLEFAVLKGFLNQTGRTIYEQMLVRLRRGASTHFKFFDVSADSITQTTGEDAASQIKQIARALMARGIVSGERVATIGVNSVRYFTLDAAIGLVGAINVPIYYTSAVNDVYDLVEASKAHTLFVGTDRMLDGLDLDKLGVQVIAMSDREDLRLGITSWQEFLATPQKVADQSTSNSDAHASAPHALEAESSSEAHASAPHALEAESSSAAHASAPLATEVESASAAYASAPLATEVESASAAHASAPHASEAESSSAAHASAPRVTEVESASDLPSFPWVSPDQTATIRYTSGTTGTPKGVIFSQRQVRWMGEVMPTVLDWRTRTARKVRYLSFLPMSHVVEGILVAYAPYYILSDIEMYYLNDFPSLADTLPKVRPNLFFSVPRFYEKVWNQLAATGAGKFWIDLPEGLLKRLLAVPLRSVILRRAGLDRCRQLIVGSAPIGMELLESFRSLGIEIHNAFGVTEAPLITLSRLGQNELGSVGQLLPETEARIGDDGQVYIRGPQVTCGYDGIEEPATDAQGWFCTGDLAEWSQEGNLILNGRKKEILVTSYGKNIAPQKIEVLLKGIDGISEAVVIADGKPFTTALMWLEEDADASSFDWAALDNAVCAINEQLSHPEQVKRWIVAARPLTVAAGELTPNLKARRNVIAQTRAELIEALYGSWDTPADGNGANALADGDADGDAPAGADGVPTGSSVAPTDSAPADGNGDNAPADGGADGGAPAESDILHKGMTPN